MSIGVGWPVRRLLVYGLVALSLLTSACTGGHAVSRGGGSTSGPVRDLSSIAMLRQAFNQDSSTVRLILLLSPT